MTEGPIASKYKRALADFVHSSSEASLETAYEIGREALKSGVSLSEVGELHYHAMHELIADQRIALATLGRSEEFFLEIATVYDMALRGYRETIGRLQVEIEERHRIEEELRKTACELAMERDCLEQKVADRTEELRLQAEQLRLRNEELRRTNGELDDFVHIASHDLREPLRAIGNHVSLLLEDCRQTLDKNAQHRLDRLVKLSGRMTQLIADLLHFSHLARAEHSMDVVDLDEIVALTAADLADMPQMHNARISVIKGLPKVWGNRGLLNALFRNLISNAIKYNDAAEKIVEIGSLPANMEEGRPGSVVLYVRDNGIGIEDRFHEEIFRIFKRLNNENAYGEGTGAGLTFVKKIVESHGGTIWLKSAPGEGTTFYFTLRQSERSDISATASPKV